MFSEAKFTEIYCMADDFCKEFALQQEKYMVKESNHNHRNKPNRMNDAEIMVILKSATPFPKCYLHKEEWTFDS